MWSHIINDVLTTILFIAAFIMLLSSAVLTWGIVMMTRDADILKTPFRRFMTALLFLHVYRGRELLDMLYKLDQITTHRKGDA